MNSNSFGTCPEHKEAFRFFDTVCKRPICADCLAFSHNGHACQSLAEAATARRSQLQSVVDKSLLHCSSLEAAAAAVAKMRKEAEAEYAREKAAIGAAFAEVGGQSASLPRICVSLSTGAEGGGGAAAGAGV